MSKKYKMVNWVDGMKIRKQHFVDQQYAFHQQAMQGVASQLHAVNFGLLTPSSESDEASYDLNIEIENTQTIHVKVSRCQAITPAGFFIDIGDESKQQRHFSIKVPEVAERVKRYLLVLSASPFNPREAGKANPEEIPPRKPYVEPKYQLGLLPKQQEETQMNDCGTFDLSIGEVIVDSSSVRLDEQYIPPCTTVYSSPLLIKKHTEFYHLLRKLETLCLQIIRKIVAKEQEYFLAIIVYKLSQEILSYLGMALYRFNNVLCYAPPIHMVENIASLGRLIRNAIDVQQGLGKEELINYFVEWCDINQGEFEKVINQIVDHKYVHTDISEAMGYCTRFLEEMVGLYSKLDGLDYIGRKSEKDIFVKEEKSKQASQKKKRINFLAN